MADGMIDFNASVVANLLYIAAWVSANYRHGKVACHVTGASSALNDDVIVAVLTGLSPRDPRKARRHMSVASASAGTHSIYFYKTLYLTYMYAKLIFMGACLFLWKQTQPSKHT